MKTKNIAFMLILGFFITSFEPCYSMDYVRNSYNSASLTVKNFIIKCREVGVLATLYTVIGVYDFKRITGLDENKLDSYSQEELENALRRIDIMARPSQYNDEVQTPSEKLSQKLNDFYNKVSLKLNNIADATKNKVAEKTEIAKDHMQDFAEKTKTYTKDTVEKVKQGTKDFVENTQEAASDLAHKSKEAAKNAATKTKDAMGNAIEYITPE